MIIKVSIEQASLSINGDTAVREKMIVLNFGSQIVVGGSVVYESSSDSSSSSSSGSSSLDWDDITSKPTFADVAYSGSYDDLDDKPSLAAVATSGAYSDLSGTPTLSAVATSGSFNDLSDSPIDSDGYVEKALAIKDTRTGVLKHIWTGTETQYGEIGDWDDDTIYFVL